MLRSKKSLKMKKSYWYTSMSKCYNLFLYSLMFNDQNCFFVNSKT